MDFDDLSIPGLIFALVAFGIGIIVSNNMNSGIVMKLLAGLVCAVAGYIVGGKIADG
jgi:hypothetical protein